VSQVESLSRVTLVSRDPERLAQFYGDAFGFVPDQGSMLAGAGVAEWLGIPGASARALTIRLGRQTLDLVDIRPPGRLYPPDVVGWSPLFQHIAIVVADMGKAYGRLQVQPGWSPISADGPERLPPASGAVTAFKFRDPDGHPLELIAFPSGSEPPAWRRTGALDVCLGIDHSAISVADTGRSIAFYETFGLQCSGRSMNFGPEQARLDAVPNAVVEVTSLAPPRCATPHLELLCYRGAFDRRTSPRCANDVVATQLHFSVKDTETLRALCTKHARSLLSGPVRLDDGSLRAMLYDPDGHLFSLVA
jgi:catechol 2,3-dioxygenase-like lactoylglutathione lyase family enzyme